MILHKQPRTETVRAFAKSAAATTRLAAARQLVSPRTNLNRRLAFADGTTSLVFRETAVRDLPTVNPAVLVVQFRLRLLGTNPLGHAFFRRECILHTPLFAGFPGFRSKLWLSDLQTGVYRGLYEWDGAQLADAYARTLARLLRVVSVRGSVQHHVTPGLRRDDLLRDPTLIAGEREWWRLCSTAQPAVSAAA